MQKRRHNLGCCFIDDVLSFGWGLFKVESPLSSYVVFLYPTGISLLHWHATGEEGWTRIEAPYVENTYLANALLWSMSCCSVLYAQHMGMGMPLCGRVRLLCVTFGCAPQISSQKRVGMGLPIRTPTLSFPRYKVSFTCICACHDMGTRLLLSPLLPSYRSSPLRLIHQQCAVLHILVGPNSQDCSSY